MHRYIITGTSGFIGGRLLRHLLLCQKGDIRCINREQEEFHGEQKVGGAPTFIHCAHPSTRRPYLPVDLAIQEAMGNPFRYLVDALEEGVRNFVLFGTRWEAEPSNSYAISKRVFKIAFKYFLKEGDYEDVSVKYLILPHVYGMGEDENRLYPMLVKAARAGEDFILRTPYEFNHFVLVDDLISYITQDILEGVWSVGWQDIDIGGILGMKLQNIDFAKMIWNQEEAKGRLLIEA